MIGSLGYLGVQIRQNTRALKANSNHAINDSFAAFLTLLIQTPEASKVLSTGIATIDALSDEDRDTFYSMLGILFGNFENAFFHYRQGNMEDNQWNRWLTAIAWYVGFPGVAVWWANRKVIYGEEFRRIVDSETARRGPTDPASWAPGRPHTSI